MASKEREAMKWHANELSTITISTPANHLTSSSKKGSEAGFTHQKSTSKENPAPSVFSDVDAITPAFWYSPTRFSKKLVFPCREMSAIQSKGLVAPKIFGCPR